jgi:hypothetical protein
MSRVFVVEPVKKNIDVKSASRFGDITYVFDGSQRHASIFNPNDYINDVVKSLKRQQFDYRTDYLCMSGSTHSIVLAAMALADRYPSIKLLMFNASACDYVEKYWQSSKGNSNACTCGAAAQ